MRISALSEIDFGAVLRASEISASRGIKYCESGAMLSFLDEGAERLQRALAATAEADLARPLPDERYRDVLPTLGHPVLHILAGHTAVHLGQMKVWRRAAGLTIPAPVA